MVTLYEFEGKQASTIKYDLILHNDTMEVERVIFPDKFGAADCERMNSVIIQMAELMQRMGIDTIEFKRL